MHCFARQNVNHPIYVTENSQLTEITDVDWRNFNICVAGAIINLANTVKCISKCCQGNHETKKAKTFKFFNLLIWTSNFALVLFITKARFDHAGRVCSADFMITPQMRDGRSFNMPKLEGLFLQAYCIVTWIQFSILVLIVSVKHLCSGGKNNRDDLERDL